MKYIFANDLRNLSFHDAIIKGINFDGADMVWTVDYIYNGGFIGGASTIRFCDFHIEEAVDVGWEHFADGWENYTDDRKNEVVIFPDIELNKSEIDELINEIRNGLSSIISLVDSKVKCGKMIDVTIDFRKDIKLLRNCAAKMKISCSKIIVEWNLSEKA